MIIKVDKEGRQAITALCDVALIHGGINNLSQVNLILSKLEDILPPQNKEMPQKENVVNMEK